MGTTAGALGPTPGCGGTGGFGGGVVAAVYISDLFGAAITPLPSADAGACLGGEAVAASLVSKARGAPGVRKSNTDFSCSTWSGFTEVIAIVRVGEGDKQRHRGGRFRGCGGLLSPSPGADTITAAVVAPASNQQ